MTGYRLPPPRSLIVLNGLLVVMFFVLMPARVPEDAAVVVQAARILVSAMVTIVYGWSIVQLWRRFERTHNHGLVIGIFLAFAADVYGGIYGLAWRLAGKPVAWTELPWGLLTAYLTAIAGIHHIAVPGSIDGRIPRRQIILVAVALGFAAGAAVVVVGVRWFPWLMR